MASFRSVCSSAAWSVQGTSFTTLRKCKGQVANATRPSWFTTDGLHAADVRCLQPLGTLNDLELDPLALA